MSRVWFVTGSSRGLGRSIAEAALAVGDSVAATARRPEQLGDLASAYGEKILPLALDVTDERSVDRAVGQAVERFGRLDVVVNNAGYADLAAVEDVTTDDFRAQVDTNFYGVVYVTKAVLPILREQGGGRIFQVSSLGDRLGSPGLGAYQSAKWAVAGFSSVVAAEVAPLGIKVTALEPGEIETDWAGSSMSVPPISEPYKQTVGRFAEMLGYGPSGGGSTPDKVAGAVLTLADHAEPPVRILLGKDAVEYGASAGKALAESDEAWRDLAVSTSRS